MHNEIGLFINDIWHEFSKEKAENGVGTNCFAQKSYRLNLKKEFLAEIVIRVRVWLKLGLQRVQLYKYVYSVAEENEMYIR